MLTLRTVRSWKARIASLSNLSMLTAALVVSAPLGLTARAATPTPMPTAAEGDEVYQGEAAYRYAEVKVLDGDVRIRKGDTDEALSRGTPIAEGDVVDSRGRGVLQLGDGTRVAFGRNTQFTVAALFTDKDGSRQVLLRLDRGSLRVNLGSDSEGRIRIDTPSGSATMDGRANATIQVDSDRSVKVHVSSGRINFSNERDQARITAGERLTVYSGQDRLDRVRSYNTYDQDEFDAWSDSYLVARRGKSWDYVPTDVRYYSDDLDENGSWGQVEDVGWVWRPRVSSSDWRPYQRGRWGAYTGGLTWVSDEPWGYVTYHYGRWGWSSGAGWYWCPGSSYSPAWVAWNWNSGYCGWAPLSYYNQPCTWGYGAWNGYHAWNVVNVNFINVTNINTRLVSDHNVIARMSGGTGTTNWTSGGPGGRSLTPPWRTSPVIATRTEFQNPGQLGTAFNRSVAQDRMVSYQRAALATTGRTVNLGPASSQGGDRVGRVPFETRGNGNNGPMNGTSNASNGRGVIATDRGAVRVDRSNSGPTFPPRNQDTPGANTRQPDRPRDPVNGRTDRAVDHADRTDRTDRTTDRSMDRGNSRTDSRTNDRPADRPAQRFEDRPRDSYRDERPTPPRDRPREEYRPAPREESRPAPRQENHTAPPREDRPAPRQESHQEPRQESRPAPQPSAPRQETRQESKPSAPAERGRNDGRH